MTRLDDTQLRQARPARDLEGLQALAGIRARLFGHSSTPLMVGRYLLRDRLGAGGLGVVHAAHDPELDREVAIKLLRDPPGHDRAREQGRLLREAQAMARLSHPNVVEVFDVGTYDGLHGLDDAELPAHGVFIVMAKLEGQTLQQWLSGEPRPVALVLERFLAAGRGLAAAHAAGLVHRDFKPGNVFLEHSGGVRVLDFGLARGHGRPAETLADGEESVDAFGDPLSSITVAGTILGTPAYMAPEQHDGDHVDARSDQYSFCAALYHGVSGVLPFGSTGLDELERRKRRRELQAPPADTAIPRWLRGILHRGLSPDPSERWPSMELLLAELRRRPRRSRRTVAGLGAGLLGLGMLGWGIAPPPPQSCESERLAASSWTEAARAAVEEALEPHDDGAQVVARLDDYARTWDREHAAACEAAPSPDELDRRMSCLRRSATHFEMLVDALGQADDSLAQRALAAVSQLPRPTRCRDVERLRAEDGPAVAPDDQPEATRLRQGITEVSALLTAGSIAAARERAAECVEQARRLDHPPLLAEALWWESHVGRIDGELESILPGFEEAAHMATAHGHDKVAALAAVELTIVLGAMARHDEALEWARHAEAAALRFGADRYPLARAYTSRGTVLRLLGRNEDAYRLYLDALEVQRRADPSSHELPTILNNLGTAALMLGRNEEALEHYRRSYERLAEILGPDHPQSAAARMNLAIAAAELGQYDDAGRHYQAARESFVRRFGPKDQRVAYTDTNLGNLLMDQGRMIEARDRFANARDLFSELLGPRHPNTATARSNWGLTQLKLGEPAQARQALRQARDDLRESAGPDHPQVGAMTSQLGQALLAEGELPAALEHLQQGLDHLRRVEAEPGLVHEARFHLARARWEAGERVAARDEAQAVAQWLRVHGPRVARDEVEIWLAEHPRP